MAVNGATHWYKTRPQLGPQNNINKVFVLEGVGEGNFTENCPKTLFFLGNSMTIKFGNFANFIVRNFVVIWEAPSHSNHQWCDAKPKMGISRKVPAGPLQRPNTTLSPSASVSPFLISVCGSSPPVPFSPSHLVGLVVPLSISLHISLSPSCLGSLSLSLYTSFALSLLLSWWPFWISFIFFGLGRGRGSLGRQGEGGGGRVSLFIENTRRGGGVSKEGGGGARGPGGCLRGTWEGGG